MLGRNKTTSSNGATPAADTAVTLPTTPVHNPRPGAKNRPTPTRKQAEAARRRPLVETDRKAAKEADKKRAREARAAQRAAAERGEESALPARDRGPQKRYIRDRVDARLNIGEIALPLMLLLLLTWMFPNRLVQTLGLALVWTVVLAGIIDAVLLWRRIKKGLVAKFGTVPQGSAQYAVARTMQIRRFRFPRPLVARGTKIE